MISLAVDMLDLQPDDRVLDLFCGLGNFTLPIATRCAHVTGVEGSQEMVQRGSENAALNRLENLAFYASDLSAALNTQAWAKERYTKILLDPPRSGAQEIVQQIASFGAQKIVYISCNPATLARDAAILVKQGYRMTKAGVMDMFPHTGHVESIAEFVRDTKTRKSARPDL
jgi:23S rRNA (uracil1939-C5)-methyltransferase